MENIESRKLMGYTFDGDHLLATFMILEANQKKKQVVVYPPNKLDEFCDEFMLQNIKVLAKHR